MPFKFAKTTKFVYLLLITKLLTEHAFNYTLISELL